MRDEKPLHYWSIWYPKAAATGLLLARALIEEQETVLLHAPGAVITVEVRNEAGQQVGVGEDLEQTQDSPICRLRLSGGRVTREDVWPTEQDVGAVVLLPGGEAGKLLQWWHAPDQKAWRWQVEFYNTLRE